MAIQHVQFNDQLQHGRMLRQALNQLEQGRESLIEIRDAMTAMVDGDGSNANMFDEVTARFGFVQTVTVSGTVTANANAKAAWDELNSGLSKLTTDASVSSVQAALLQLFKKLR